MDSPHTFIGKVATLAVGMGLSWGTVMHHDFARVASALLGEEAIATMASSEPSTHPRVAAGPHPSLSQDGREQPVRSTAAQPPLIQQLCNQLRQRGASYVLLERLSSGPQASYRARCDVASSSGGVKCCFEATRSTAVAALEEVLEAVLQQASRAP